MTEITHLHIFQKSELFLLFLKSTLEGQFLESCISLKKRREGQLDF